MSRSCGSAAAGLSSPSDDSRAPLLLLGSDSYGRDVFSRLLFGGRVSLGLALIAALGALVLGASVGGLAGYAGGPADDVLMRASDIVLVLPAMYVALALRSVLPLVLSPRVVFLLLAGIFAIVGAPFFARGVRAIVRSERRQDYAVAATSLGASHARVLARHLLPAARGFMVVQITMLVPAFIIAEATLSYVGLGFPDPTASWGTMLHEASNVRVFRDFPWLLSPAAAMFIVVLALNLVLERADMTVRLKPDTTVPDRRVRLKPDTTYKLPLRTVPGIGVGAGVRIGIVVQSKSWTSKPLPGQPAAGLPRARLRVLPASATCT